MRPYKKQTAPLIDPIVIGYYPIRGKAQICRLLCEYLHIPYVDAHFTPDYWNQFKDNQAENWIIKDLPFCKDGKFVVTGVSAISHYLIQKSGRSDLFGKDLKDKIKIDSIRSKQDIKEAILALVCSCRPSLSLEEKKNLKYYWINKIQPVLLDYQRNCPLGGWYYGYITIIDFAVYQLLNLIQSLFPEELGKFKKLYGLCCRFKEIPEIRNYQNSSRAVHEYCPVRYFNRYIEERQKWEKVKVKVEVVDLMEVE